MIHASQGVTQKAITLVGCIVTIYATLICIYYTGQLLLLLLRADNFSPYDATAFIVIILACAFGARLGLGLATLYPSFQLEESGVRLRFLNIWQTTIRWSQI